MQDSSSSSGTGSPKLGDARAASAYDQLVGSAFAGIVERLGKLDSGIFVFAPCGCSRAELLKRLLKPGAQVISHAYVYEGFEEKTGDVRDIVKYESLVDLVGKLKGWSGGARIAVVPESSCEAVALKQMLEKEAPYLRVQLLYLPQLYREAAERYSENVKNLARVKHSSLGKAYGCKAEGYSSTLLREWGEQLEKLEEAKEAVLKLSPGTLGLKDYLRYAGVKALAELGAAVFGVPVALAMERALKPVAELGLSGAASALLDRVRKIPSQRVEELVSRVLISFAKPEARDKVAEGLARFIASARDAARHLDGGWLEDALETVWDQVALEWGMDARNFKILVENFAKIASGEVVTREELRKELGKLLGEEAEKILKPLIEEQLKEAWEELRKELEELKLKVKEVNDQFKLGIPLLYLEDVEGGKLYDNLVVREGKLMIENKEREREFFVELVTAGRFEELAGEVLERLGGSGFVVLVGPKGVGKSALAAYAVWLALRDGFADAAVRVSGMERGESLKLKRLAENVDRGRFIAVYDPSPLQAYYEPGAYAREVRKAFERSSVGGFLVEETLRELLSLKGVERVSVLVVLPDDIYQSLIEQNPELRSELERYTLRVDLRDPLFLEEVVKAYSGCTSSFKELAESIARFEGGYTLVAKYAGLTLREKKCSVEDVQTALREAKGKPKLFLAYYLWSVLLKGSRDLAMMAAAPLILHSFYGPIPEGVTYLMKAALEGGRWRLPDPERLRGVRLRSLEVEELKPLARWLSVLHEDLVEETLRELCRLEYRELEELTEALDWAWSEILREEEKVTVLERLPGFVGKRLEAALEAYATSCWRRLALVAGSALAWHLRAPLVAASEPKVTGELPQGFREALEPCEADDYLLVGGVIPPLLLGVALFSPHTLARPLARCYKEAAKEIEKLEETWRERGYAYPVERLYALGLALSVAEAKRLGEGVDWEAEAALYAAAAAVPRVSRAECVAAVLEVFKPLGELAPHYHVKLASAASELPELGEDAVREIADAVDGALQNHGEELKEKAWPLVDAVLAYSNLLTKHAEHLSPEERELTRGRMCELLSKLEGQLRVIAEALALLAALERGLELCGGGGAASKAVELLEKLERMEGEELSEQAVEWAKELAFKPEGFKLAVKEVRGRLAHALARYTMDNDDLEAAEELFESAAAIARGLENWENYLAALSLAARCSALKAGSLEELKESAKIFGSLWSEAKRLEKEATASLVYLENEADALAEYLVSLALEGRVGEVSKLLDGEGRLLERFADVGVVVRLLLERLGVEVEKPKAQEIAEALRNHIDQVYRPAFNFLMGLPEGVPDECIELKDEKRALRCLLAVAAVLGDEEAARVLKAGFLELLGEIVDFRLKSLTQGSEEREAVECFRRELKAFVEKRNAGNLVQLLAPAKSLASFVLMLWALSSDDEELARAHAKLASIIYEGKLLRRLFREAAEAQGERFELALLKLFYYHF